MSASLINGYTASLFSRLIGSAERGTQAGALGAVELKIQTEFRMSMRLIMFSPS